MKDPRSRFIKGAIKVLRRDGFKQKTLELVLRACWSHGASVALFIPGFADDILDGKDRRAFASGVIDMMSGNELKSEGFTRKQIEVIIADLLEMEHNLPMTRLSGDIDLLMTQKCAN